MHGTDSYLHTFFGADSPDAVRHTLEGERRFYAGADLPRRRAGSQGTAPADGPVVDLRARGAGRPSAGVHSARSLEELAGGVVRQDPAVGLAGGAVGDGVVAVLDGPEGRVADDAGLALPAVDRTRAVAWRSSSRRASARRPGPPPRSGRWRRGAGRARRRPASWWTRTARAGRGSRSRWPAVGRPRRAPTGRAGGCGGASSGCAPARRARPRSTRSASGPIFSTGGWPSTSPSHDPQPGLVLGAGLGEEEGGAGVEAQSHEPAARFGRFLGVGSQPSALHEVDDEGERREPQQEVLAPLVDPIERAAHGDVGRRHGGLQGGEREGTHTGEGLTAVGGGQSFGVGPDLGQLGHARLTTRCGRAAIGSGRSSDGEERLRGRGARSRRRRCAAVPA